MAATVYVLGALVTLLCAVLLLRGYAKSRMRLLLWSGLCFIGLTVSNALLIVDLVLIPGSSLYALRLGTAAVGMAFMLYGLIWDSE